MIFRIALIGMAVLLLGHTAQAQTPRQVKKPMTYLYVDNPINTSTYLQDKPALNFQLLTAGIPGKGHVEVKAFEFNYFGDYYYKKLGFPEVSLGIKDVHGTYLIDGGKTLRIQIARNAKNGNDILEAIEIDTQNNSRVKLILAKAFRNTDLKRKVGGHVFRATHLPGSDTSGPFPFAENLKRLLKGKTILELDNGDRTFSERYADVAIEEGRQTGWSSEEIERVNLRGIRHLQKAGAEITVESFLKALRERLPKALNEIKPETLRTAR